MGTLRIFQIQKSIFFKVADIIRKIDITQVANQGGGLHEFMGFSKIFIFKSIISEKLWGPTMSEKYLQKA